MKMIIEIDPVEEKDYAQIIANIAQISYGLFELRYNIKKRIEWRIDANTFDDQYAVLDAVLEEINELFPNIDTQ